MQFDKHIFEGVPNQNIDYRKQSIKLSSNIKILEQKYQKSLKQMSSIIHANQNLKKQLDNIKQNIKNEIQNNIKDIKINYEKKIQQLIKNKNDINIKYQNLLRQKQQNKQNIINMQKKLWQYQKIKNQLLLLKKQNQKLILKSIPYNQSNINNNQQKIKYNSKIQQLNNQITNLNLKNKQNTKIIDLLDKQKFKLNQQLNKLSKNNQQLTLSIQKINIDNLIHSNQNTNKTYHSKNYQIQIMQLKKKNAQLTNTIQKFKIQKMQITSQVNKNQAQINLLNTLRSLHSQLQPMRYQIQQLKRDKYFDRENTNKQKTQLQIKLLTSQHERDSLKRCITDLQNKNRQLNQQNRQKNWQKYKVQQLEEEKRILQGRVIVYEAMQMVSKNRDKPPHVQRIKQFQRRIHLLLQQQNLQYLVNNANVHQLIAMKAYVIQLDNKLQVVIQQNQHINKKYSNFKQKYQQLVSQNKKIINKHYSMVNAYKSKIQGYQKLIIKLTEQLEKHIKQNQGSSVESQYKSMIILYESKILNITNEINAKKQQNREIQKRLQGLQLQIRGKLDIIKQLEIQLSTSRKQNKDLNIKLLTQQNQQLDKYNINKVNSNDQYKIIINNKTKQIVQLQDQLSKFRLKFDKISYQHNQQIQNYKYKINSLEIQIQQLRLQPNSQNKYQLMKNSGNLGEIVQKINLLEKNIGNNNQKNNQKLQESTVFIHQINHLKNDVGKITLLLQNRIVDLETQLEKKTNQLNNYSQSPTKTYYLNQSIESPNIQLQNIRLKSQLQRMKYNYKLITQQSQRLMIKIKDTQQYISTLKNDFNNVSMKISDYQKKLSIKQNQIYEQKCKYNNLQQQYDNQLRVTKSKISEPYYKQYNQKQRYSIQSDDKLQIKKRQIDLKTKQIQKRQQQTNKKQLLINNKNKQFLQKLKKIQQRQKIIYQQQNKKRKSDQLWNNQGSFVNSYSQVSIKQYKQQIIKLQSKIKKLQLQKNDSNKTIQIKDEKIQKLVRQKIQLSRQLQDLNFEYSGKTRFQQHNEKQIINLKQQITKLEQEIQKLWRDQQILKQQLRNKQRQFDEINLQLNQINKKYQIQIKQLNIKLNDKNYQIQTLSNLQNSPTKKINYDQIQRQIQQRIRQIQQRNRNKIKQLYASNQQNVRQLQQIISNLNAQLNKCKMLGASQSKREIQAHTATIQSLETHIGSLKREIQRKQFNAEHLEEEIKYYKGVVEQRDQQIFKMHQNSYIPITQNQFNQADKIRMQREINQLQNSLYDMRNTMSNHDECIKKESLLRIEIERLNGIVQQKTSIGSQKQANLFDLSYFNELKQTNKQLQQDLALERKRLMVGFQIQRNVDEYLAILVVTFAEVDALRQRVHQLQTNYKEQQERQLNVLKKLDHLQQHQLDIAKILGILKELQDSHRAFHEQQEISRSAFVRRMSADVLNAQGNQSMRGYQNAPESHGLSQQMANANGSIHYNKFSDHQRSQQLNLTEEQPKQVLSNYIRAQNLFANQNRFPEQTPYKTQSDRNEEFNRVTPSFNLKEMGSKNRSVTQSEIQEHSSGVIIEQIDQSKDAFFQGQLDQAIRSPSKRLQFNQTQASYNLAKGLETSTGINFGNSSMKVDNSFVQ